MAILTVPSLEGMQIEVASIRTMQEWKLGKAKSDKGLLLLLALQEHKVRIEVGQGLEGLITDVQASRIIRDSMIPLLKTDDYDNAVIVGAFQMLSLALPDVKVEELFKASGNYSPRHSKKVSLSDLLFVFILLVIIFSRFFSRGGRSGFGGGGFYGGFGGGFGGGGGSRLGGGGGFSGGGASGSW